MKGGSKATTILLRSNFQYAYLVWERKQRGSE